jgi:hypothetical protein
VTQPTEQFQHEISGAIRSFTLTFLETTDWSSCVNRVFKAGGKNFVSLGEKDDEPNIRLKLDASIPEIELLATNDARFDVGMFGWTMLRFPPNDPPPIADLERRIAESLFLLAPRRSQPSQRNPSVAHNATMADRVRCVTPERSCAGR